MFALEDQDELGFWGHLMGLREVAERSLQSAMNAVGNDMAEAIRELMRRTHTKSEFLRRESGMWANVPQLRGLLEQINEFVQEERRGQRSPGALCHPEIRGG